jgi:hypothetical protein
MVQCLHWIKPPARLSSPPATSLREDSHRRRPDSSTGLEDNDWVEKYHLPVRWTPLRLVAVPPPCLPPVEKAFHRRRAFAVASHSHQISSGKLATPFATNSPRQGFFLISGRRVTRLN